MSAPIAEIKHTFPQKHMQSNLLTVFFYLCTGNSSNAAYDTINVI